MASGWPCFEQPNSQTPLKKITHERPSIGRASRGGLGAGVGIYQTLSKASAWRLHRPSRTALAAFSGRGWWLGSCGAQKALSGPL